MRTVTLSILLVSTVMFACAANAQDAPEGPPASSDASLPQSAPAEPPAYSDSWRQIPGLTHDPLQAGLDALDAGNLAKAETLFAKFLRRNGGNAMANFYLGATRMDLGKWDDAKKHLEIAARKLRNHPDPKSRLGVTYARLGDTAGAYAQRAALMKMADNCKDTCRLSPYIKRGIQMIDEALGQAPAAFPETVPAA